MRSETRPHTACPGLFRWAMPLVVMAAALSGFVAPGAASMAPGKSLSEYLIDGLMNPPIRRSVECSAVALDAGRLPGLWLARWVPTTIERSGYVHRHAATRKCRRVVDEEGKPVTVYGTADHPGAQVGGILFAGGGLVSWLDVARRASRRRRVEELTPYDSTFEFSSVYRPAEGLSTERFGGCGGPSRRRSACLPGLSHAAGTSGDPAISESLPGDGLRPAAPGTRTPGTGMTIPDLCTCLCTELSETLETVCNACDVVDREIRLDLCV